MTAFVNPARDPARVPAADGAEATAFHRALPGYAPTPVRELPELAAELGVGAVLVKDESNRFGLPAFKVLGASWAIERTLRTEPGIHTLVAASAGNHGRAVAHVAATRGLACRVFLPARSARARREAIAGEGAEVVVVDGTYEEAVVARALRCRRAGRRRDRRRRRFPAGLMGDRRLRHALRRGRRAGRVRPAGRAGRSRIARGGSRPIRSTTRHSARRRGARDRGVPHGLARSGSSRLRAHARHLDGRARLLRDLLDRLAVAPSRDDRDDHRLRRRRARRDAKPRGRDNWRSATAAPQPSPHFAASPKLEDLSAAVGFGPSTRALLVATEGPTDPDAYAEVIRGSR